MAQARTAEARVQSQASPGGICGSQSGTEIVNTTFINLSIADAI